MAGIFSFKCSCCGEVHEGSPSFGFSAPDHWLGQDDGIKSEGKLGDDLCYYQDEDGYHYFARVILEIPIDGVSEPFMWGVWVSLSRSSYEHYVETWSEPDPQRGYFGWLCNQLPYYESTHAMGADVYPQPAGKRPILSLHQTDHELYQDFIDGITVEKAQHIAELAMHG